MRHFADVILPLPLSKPYTYAIPPEWVADIATGSRVIVPFGKRKYYTAIVVHTHQIPPADYETKEILSLLDKAPILRRPQLKLWEWIASYYLYSIGDVYKAAVPSGLKLESETVVTINAEYERGEAALPSEREAMLLDTLANNEKMTLIELEKVTGLRNILPTIRGLIEQEAICINEQLKSAYNPKQEVCVKLTFSPDEREKLRELFAQLASAKKQTKLLMAYLDLSHFMRKGELLEVSKKSLLERAEVTSAVLNTLTAKGIMECYKREVSRVATTQRTVAEAHPLNELQQAALESTLQQFKEKPVVLLHGVTSSGKTEVYIHLMQAALESGRQVLYLVPEIALTTQLTERLQRVFGNKLAIYHSKFSDNERVEVWNNLLQNKGVEIVLGVRSSIFLPFRDLGLVIVDEEHENTYKQQDPAPRYHARNAAIVLASMHGAKTLLGSATPAIESYYNALQGKYGLVEMLTRYEGIEMPRIEVVDLKKMRQQRAMQGNFSPRLVELSQQATAQGEQVILFQNRRGFAPVVECKMCAWMPKCKHCDVGLTYHKRYNQLTCHYCGYTYEIPRQCPACGNTSIEIKGFGTERIEEDIAALFPEQQVARMDTDTTRSRKAYEQIIADFQQNKSSILIGTQMVTKGLDFDNVSVVGILAADSLMNFPDFRANERAFQLMAQVAGRAGRRNKQGTVVLQTAQPEHPLIEQVVGHDYLAMYHTQLAEREQFCYPPFYRLIYIYMKHRNEQTLHTLSCLYAGKLRQLFGDRILGPDQPPVSRIQSLYIRKIVLKIESQASLPRVRELLHSVYDEMLKQPNFKSVMLYYDVDPM